MQFEIITDVEIQNETAFESAESEVMVDGQEPEEEVEEEENEVEEQDEPSEEPSEEA